MRTKISYQLAALSLGAVILGTAGCATKKFVRQDVQQSVQPLQAGLSKANQGISDNAGQIRDVDHKAETGISNAQSSADQAHQAAQQADQHAQAANQLAQQGVTTANQAQDTANNLDNYQAGQHETVLFGLNKSTLTTEDKQTLDQLVQAVKPMKHYVIQVQGYTDTSGPKAVNLQLSQRRADAVVRYLSLNGNIPLVKIYNMGYGEAAPAESNHTRKGRKANRRVDVTVMVPQIPGQAAQASPTASTDTQ
ncbi:MAG TPA: OmpA family protein [Terriglobia bacterium]|nr:OmpA family protein [Terriglobia bacterium]